MKSPYLQKNKAGRRPSCHARGIDTAWAETPDGGSVRPRIEPGPERDAPRGSTSSPVLATFPCCSRTTRGAVLSDETVLNEYGNALGSLLR